jgi:glucose-6-phosphate isomerase
MLHFDRDFVFEDSAAQKETIEAAFSAVSEEYESRTIGYYTLPQDSLDIVGAAKALEQSNSLLESGKITDIAVIGIGGVGGYYGGLLAKRYFESKDVEITFVARGRHLEEIKANGLRVLCEKENFTEMITRR